MSSQDGSNRSQRNRRAPQRQRPDDARRRQDSTWDVDPAEIDRYLSGRPARDEDTSQRTGRQTGAGNTADQLNRLQNAVRRQPRPVHHDDDEMEDRYQPVRRERYRTPPASEPNPYYDDDPEDYGSADMHGAEEDDYDEAAWEEPTPQRRQPSRRPAPQAQRVSSRQRPPQRSSQPASDVYEDDYDDELYNDDPYLGYEDDRIDRRPVRTPRQRPQVRVSKPNLPKITIPRSVTDSPILADTPSLIMIGVAILSVALMSFVVSDRVGLLSETIPTHVNASGDGENFMTRDAVWLIPLLAGMVMLMNAAASWFIARIDRFATRFLLAGGLLVHFIAWVAVFKYLWP